MGKGIRFPFGVIACLLIAMISGRLLQAEKLKKFHGMKLRAIKTDLEFSAYATNAKLCGTSPILISNFKSASNELEELTTNSLINPAERACCTDRSDREYNKGFCELMDTFTKRRIQNCEKKIFPTLEAAWEKIPVTVKQNVGKFHSSLPEVGFEALSNFMATRNHPIIASKENFPTCTVIIEGLSRSLPRERVERLGLYNGYIWLWSSYLYECKKYVAGYCSEVDSWKKRCSDITLSHAFLPDCGSDDLNKQVKQCESIEEFI